MVAADVLWSDPVMEPGLRENEQRGVGLTFGPDVTQVCLLPCVCVCDDVYACTNRASSCARL